LLQHIEAMTREVEVLVKQHPICSRLTALEGIGPIGALLLYATLGSGNVFSSGREFAAYLGLAPRQYSSGGKTNIVGLSKKVGNCRLRSMLILGARAYTYRLKEPKSAKDRWLKAAIDRNGQSSGYRARQQERKNGLGDGDPGNTVSASRPTEGGCLNVLQTKTLIR
jgi:transposase